MHPWQAEPNRVEFKYKGYHCLVNRAHPGNLCGYVALPNGHPYYGKHYEDIDIGVHGGLTYAGACQGDICHVPEEGESDDVWWIGFDCAHSGDLVPETYEMLQSGGILHDHPFSCYLNNAYETYKTVAFVKKEIRHMVKQLEKTT